MSILDELGLDPDDFDWEDLAACQNMPLNYFYERYEEDTVHARNADALCFSCPVQRECLKTGVENKEWGLWGGVFLNNGVVDVNRNEHKSEEDWERVRQGIDKP